MALNTQGLSGVVFGLPNYATGWATQSADFSKKPGIVAEVNNASGRRVHVRYDDETVEGSIELIFDGGQEPVVGTAVTYNGIKYEVTSIDIKWSNNAFKSYSVKFKNSENLTLV